MNMSGPTVGVVANPASGRDVRRLVAHGSAVTAHDKVNVLTRLMTGLARAGVTAVISMTDRSGVSAGLARACSRRSADGWPTVHFLDHALTSTPTDTVVAVELMMEAGVEVIIVLGGDGTNNLVAHTCRDIPVVAISTGTNNSFPLALEPTVAGLAAGLVATGAVAHDAVTERAKMLAVNHAGRIRHALVDVAVLVQDRIGSGAIWDVRSVRELFLTFARADAIGLSSVGGHLCPVGRYEPYGLAVRLVPAEPSTSAPSADSPTGIRPPIGPGLFADLEVEGWDKLQPGEARTVAESAGVLAIDGERIIEFDQERQGPVTVDLVTTGPPVVDVARTLDLAASAGLLVTHDRPATTTSSKEKRQEGEHVS